jgi:hypothetical protein
VFQHCFSSLPRTPSGGTSERPGCRRPTGACWWPSARPPPSPGSSSKSGRATSQRSNRSGRGSLCCRDTSVSHKGDRFGFFQKTSGGACILGLVSAPRPKAPLGHLRTHAGETCEHTRVQLRSKTEGATAEIPACHTRATALYLRPCLGPASKSGTRPPAHTCRRNLWTHRSSFAFKDTRGHRRDISVPRKGHRFSLFQKTLRGACIFARQLRQGASRRIGPTAFSWIRHTAPLGASLHVLEVDRRTCKTYHDIIQNIHSNTVSPTHPPASRHDYRAEIPDGPE